MKSYPYTTEYTVGGLKGHKELKPKLLEEIDRAYCEPLHVIDAYYSDDIHRVDWCSHSDFSRPWAKLLLESGLKEYVNKFAAHKGFDSWVIHELWFQQYKTGGTHGWHVHGHNFTAVYYADIPEGAPITELVLANGDVITPEAKEGDILIFPSFVVHRAPLNASEEQKTIISFNMSLELPILDSLPKG